MRRLELLSFLVGAATALSLLAGWRVPAGSGQVGTDLMLSIGRSNAVELSRTGTVVSARDLRPGRRVEAAVVAHNPGAAVLRLRPTLQVASGAALARELRAELRADGRQLYAGSLAGLTARSAPLRLAPGRSSRVQLVVTLPRSAGATARGRTFQGSLVLEASR